MTTALIRKVCSGCGTPDRRIDTCPTCRAGASRAKLNGHSRPRKPDPAPPPPTVSVVRWELWFVPSGPEEPKILEHTRTADEGQKLAEVYNRLDWEEHASLGAGALLALGRKGTFILEPRR